jgi:hypothetical protein
MAEQLDISLVERQSCANEFWNPTTHPSSLWRRSETSCGFQGVEALQRRRNERERIVLRSASLAKGGTSKKRPSPHLHKDPTLGNELFKRPSYLLYCVRMMMMMMMMMKKKKKTIEIKYRHCQNEDSVKMYESFQYEFCLCKCLSKNIFYYVKVYFLDWLKFSYQGRRRRLCEDPSFT